MLYYWYVFAIDKKNRFGKSTIMWMVMLFLLCFSSNVWNKERLQKHIERITGAANPNLSKLLFAGSLEQMLLIVAALFIVYRLFSKVLAREKELSHQVIDAEERNRAKTSFLSSMSHDIRTPMNAIIGFTDLALLDLDNREKVEEYLKKIKGSSAHLLSLINDVLEMSRIESGKIELVEEPMNMGELLKEVKDILLGQVAEKNQSLLVSLEDMTRKTVKCDRLRMNQVILILASNAIKYTPEGGDISIVFRQLNVVDAEHVRCELRVKDNGIGMSEEFACKIFEAFERERTSTMSGVQGTGLGMAITKSIVDLMGGTIEVKTELGKGTEIIVHLTLALAEPESVKKAGEELSTEHFKGKRILLVDDMLINRQLASAVLRLYGISVEEAKDGSEAVEMVKEAEAGYYDLVLMDIQMPKMDGYEAARHIRALEDSEKSSVPILALTANAFQEDKKLGAKAGMNGHVSKPIVRKQLIEELYQIWK
jgi:signal transduction histidine kinase